MVVAQVFVLVVGRIEVGDVALEFRRGLEHVERVGLALARLRAWQELGQAQAQGVVRAPGPLLQVGHLQSGGRVHPIRRLHQGGEQDRFQLRGCAERGDGVADGVDAGAVLRAKEAALLAEGVGEVAGLAGEGVESGDLASRDHGELLVIRLHVAAGQGRGVGVVVVGEHAMASALQGVADARRAAEEIEHGARFAQRIEDIEERRHQRSLAADVLDHGGRSTVSSPLAKAARRRDALGAPGPSARRRWIRSFRASAGRAVR